MREQDFGDLEKLFLALGDKTRLKLLSLMAGGPVSVGFLTDGLGASQPKVSRHLAYLRNCGLVETRRDGKWIYYGLREQTDPTLRGALTAVLCSLAEMQSGGRDQSDDVRDDRMTGRSQDRAEYRDKYAEPYITDKNSSNELEIFLL